MERSDCGSLAVCGPTEVWVYVYVVIHKQELGFQVK